VVVFEMDASLLLSHRVAVAVSVKVAAVVVAVVVTAVAVVVAVAMACCAEEFEKRVKDRIDWMTLPHLRRCWRTF
jgi:hypothetical protein